MPWICSYSEQLYVTLRAWLWHGKSCYYKPSKCELVEVTSESGKEETEDKVEVGIKYHTSGVSLPSSLATGVLHQGRNHPSVVIKFHSCNVYPFFLSRLGEIRRLRSCR